MDLLSTSEAARIIGAGTTSVKRWADTGRLDCVRTAGGHRRFRRSALDRFMRSQAHEENSNDETERWVDVLLSGCNYDVPLIQARARSTSWCEVAVELDLALVELGERCHRSDVGPSTLLVVSERLSRALARITDSLFLPFQPSKCLLASVEGERHTLGLSFVEICLRELGWDSLWLGGMVPAKAIIEQVRLNDDVRLVGLSATSTADASSLSLIQAQVTSICRAQGIELLLGGNGPWPASPRYGTRISSFHQLEGLRP